MMQCPQKQSRSPGTGLSYSIVGYTMIELLMVFSIIALLATMSAPAMLSSMRHASFTRAVNEIRALHVEAQSAARRVQPESAGLPAGNWGVRLRTGEDGAIVGIVLKGEVEIEESQRRLPASVFLFENGAMTSDDDGVVEWWYLPASGLLTDGPLTNRAGVMLGLPRPAPEYMPFVSSPEDLLLLNEQNDPDGDPGLELSNRRGDLRAAIRIYPIGVLTLVNLPEKLE